MSEAVSYSVRDGIAVISMNNPPVNGLGSKLRPGIMESLKKADADPAVKAAVLWGSPKVFSGGADIREFNTPKSQEPPSLPEINAAQDEMKKPLVAAIGGFAMGGGLELALGCHYRVAAPRTQLALPEVKLGILPGSGGTQRLPRIIPVAKAVEMMTTGNPIPAEEGKKLGLIDEIASGDLLESAVAYAKQLVAEGKGPRRIRDLTAKVDGDPKAFFAQVRDQVAKASRGYPAPLEIVACAEAGGHEAVRRRTQVRARALRGPQSRRPKRKRCGHMFFAERQTTKIPDVPEDTPTREIRKAAVIGAGTMGGGITMSLVSSGIRRRSSR
jgi:3-hydroxyacyl-CoA dehydrogenase